MTDSNPKIADLSEILAGRTFPKTQVPVFFDEDLQYKLSLLERAMVAAPLDEGITAKRDELLETLKAHKYTVHLTGVPRRLKKDLLETVMEKYPQQVETNFLGQKMVKENPKADEEYANKRLALHIERLEFPDGRIVPGSEEVAVFLRGEAPDSAMNAIENGVLELDEGAKSGYESAVIDLDF